MKRFSVNLLLQISFAFQKRGPINPFTNEELLELIQKATAGDKPSLETVMLSVQDLVFNLSLRMMGTFPDAEDASQDILLKVMSHLSSFKGGSSFST